MALLQQLEAAKDKKRAPVPRVLQKHDTDEVVKRRLRDNFPQWKHVSTDGKRIQGLTLRERLTEDVRKKKKNGDSAIRFNKVYYATLRNLYGTG